MNNIYGPKISGLDINEINKFNSDFGNNRNNEILRMNRQKEILQNQKKIQEQRLREKLLLEKRLQDKRKKEEEERIREQKKLQSQLKRNRDPIEYLDKNSQRSGMDIIESSFSRNRDIPDKLEDRDEIEDIKDSQILKNLIDEEKKREATVKMVQNVDDGDDLVVNEGELNYFKEKVRRWLTYDDEIRILQNALKDRRKKKNELTPEVLEFMKTHNIEDLNTKDGKLKCSISNRKKTLTQKDIKHKLLGYFKNENKGEKCIDYVFGNREIQEIMNLRRTFKKK